MNDVVNYGDPVKIIQVLEWLEQRGFHPTQETARIAALNGHLNVLDWLEQRGVLPPVGTFQEEDIMDMTKFDVLRWLGKRGL